MTSAVRPLPRPPAATRMRSCVGQRAADQQSQHRLGESRRDAQRFCRRARLQQDVALALEIARRAALGALHFGDLAAELLPLGDERQQLPIERAQAFA